MNYKCPVLITVIGLSLILAVSCVTQPSAQPTNSTQPTSTDRGKVAFVSNQEGEGHYNIYAMNVDGSNQVQLTSGPNYIEGFSWAPDGARLAFSAQFRAQSQKLPPQYNIYVINADGSGQMQITNSNSDDKWPAWSPDGKKCFSFLIEIPVAIPGNSTL